MSDSESVAIPSSHPAMGGKSLASMERPKYKSWRKKYRKMRVAFDSVLEENRKAFKQEQRLETIARRLREELDGLLDLCLDLNQTPALPPELRFNVSLPQEHTAVASYQNIVPPDVTPEQADAVFLEYTNAVQNGHIPPLDVYIVREQIERQLAAQGTVSIDTLNENISHTVLPPDTAQQSLPPEMRGDEPPGFLTSEQEGMYLLRLDASLGDPHDRTTQSDKQKLAKEAASNSDASKFLNDLAPREADRQMELQNPQSQYNWLKLHVKADLKAGAEMDDSESLASAEVKTPRASGTAGASTGTSSKRNLAKQVGERALLERAREGVSPSATSATFIDDDDMHFIDEHPSSKKRSRGDADGPYKGKSAKSGGSIKTKRKRTGDDLPANGGGTSKKAKTANVDHRDAHD